jgi:Protein of unknown function (DUF1634)
MRGAVFYQLEHVLASTLYWGTWLASSVVAVGLAKALLDSRAARGETVTQDGMRIMSAGIALFIVLPVIRVVVMLFGFLRERDYRFAVIAALVMTIIVLGLLAGSHI